MIRKLFLSAAVLLFVSLAVAGNKAKTYSIVLGSPTVAGEATLKPGEYKVRADGPDVVFTNVRTLETCTVPVKIESATRKHEATAVKTTVQNGRNVLLAIDLGGTDETLEFGVQ